MTGPQWRWDYLDARDDVLERPVSPAFTSRYDAEAWIGEHWRELAAVGVVAARIMHQGHPVAPPLPLRQA